MSRIERFVELLDSQAFGGGVETDAATRVVYGTDNSIYQLRPEGVAIPKSIDDLVEIARTNSSLEQPMELVARGGGTGTNGQSLTDGLVVDTRRAMNRIVSIDADARRAVVQPGVVLGQLNAALQPHGLFFAPHVSTASRATIGGMVSTDAAGKGSLVHGRTNSHVVSIDVVLADGTPWSFRALDPSGLANVCGRDDRVGEVHRAVSAAVDELDPTAFPDIPRGFSGYNLKGATERPGLDMTKILAGSEGTLALIGQIEIALTPLPHDPHLAVVAYESFEEAMHDANRLKVTSPTAIECLDDRTMSLAATSPAFPQLAALLAEGGGFTNGSLLLLEYEGAAGMEQLRDLLADAEGCTTAAITRNPVDIAAVWKVRADAVGLLGQAVRGRRSVAFVEDCAVPPHRLEAFVAAFRELLDGHGLDYGMFGHADVGCVHVRPALDLYDEDHEVLVRTISDGVADLVAEFGGVLWGEHGRGFRGEFLDLDEDTTHRMRQIKTAFDPNNVLNPGKLYAPLDVSTPITRIDEVPLRIHRDRTVAVERRNEFESAFSCNGNGICHHWGGAEVMCPSYKVTSDPRLSPKGRADMLRSWLADPDDGDLADDLAASMSLCLSCGACTGRCPVQVDIPEMKSQFLSQYSDPSRRRRLRDAALSRFESVLPKAQRGARIVRFVQGSSAPLLERFLGVVDLPSLPAGSLDRRLRELDVPVIETSATGYDVGAATVVVLPDAFTAYLDSDVLVATLRVMQALGERPALAPFVPSGKFDHVTGRRRRFAAAVARQRDVIERLAATGTGLVVVEPAVSLLAQHEYTATDRAFPADSVTSLADFASERLDRLPASNTGRSAPNGVAQLFGHCTEVSLSPSRMTAYRSMLEAAGYDVVVESTSCCGMAGIFGHEAENQEMSAALFDRDWRPRLDADGPSVRCASGYSCRSQARRFGSSELVHPIQVLADAIARDRSIS